MLFGVLTVFLLALTIILHDTATDRKLRRLHRAISGKPTALDRNRVSDWHARSRYWCPRKRPRCDLGTTGSGSGDPEHRLSPRQEAERDSHVARETAPEAQC